MTLIESDSHLALVGYNKHEWNKHSEKYKIKKVKKQGGKRPTPTPPTKLHTHSPLHHTHSP